MSWSRSGVSLWPMLVTWTTCSAAPVAAASAITSSSAATLPPLAGSRPPSRRYPDQGAAFARRIPGGHRVGPDFELQGRGDAVVRVVAVALGVLAVGVEVDESGGDHEAAHVQRLPRGG